MSHYDVLIVGAGVAGCALAHALSTLQRPKPLRICLLERSLAEPDRIVGELLQPGGVIALQKLGMEDCLDGIDAIPMRGYCVVLGGQPVQIPYPDADEGRSFHHGRFIQTLRKKAKQAVGVDVIEATVTELVECQVTGRVLGVRAIRKQEAGEGAETAAAEKETFLADLTVVADGCFSNFRTKVLGEVGVKPALKSYFVGVILDDAHLPIAQHGTVVLVKGHGPVLLYQIGQHDTRMLVDLKDPLPADIKETILTDIMPQLPTSLQEPVRIALEKDRLRRMPNSFLPPAEQGGRHTKEGVFLLGDSWNMRHPLTGGGMTVAFNDVVTLRDLLRDVDDFGDWKAVSGVLHRWHWSRKRFASTINVLSLALYDLFGADDENLEVLRTGCFKYFELGGNCIREPASLLSGTKQSTLLLAYHFFAVALYAIWVMFTHPRQVGTTDAGKPVYARPRMDEYPFLAVKCVQVLWTACMVFMPLIWTEIRWW
ncbi:squalene monooxygenase [Laetiporus sulphureus 93-53]|uniref:Squalene monooxygenase n=1 Tax=Laetiporus sulphureus 93-53 TaxID=1314785 RepID=A0A165D2H6_9APHY|nr:squalene monooxygenase [Laetiporus sulphureus 93-53]KZT04024.1 squalene monooxygenase [Laetiporus sulphureus 93-53]